MTNHWQSLYLYCADTPAIVSTLNEALCFAGYTSYDPFAGPLTPVYRRTFKGFIAPPAQGWTRILMEQAPEAETGLLHRLSHLALALYVQFASQTASESPALVVRVAQGGGLLDPQTALSPFLKAGLTSTTLAQALAGQAPAAPTPAPASPIPLEALPDDLQAMAGKLKGRHISRMFDKLMQGVNQHVPGDQAAALALLRSATVDWDSVGGQRLQALMGCLSIPSPYWHQPDFLTLRDAYQLHHRRRKNPNAALYPGDADAMNALPDALRYTPVYGGMAD